VGIFLVWQRRIRIFKRYGKYRIEIEIILLKDKRAIEIIDAFNRNQL
jgi:hypothetical protein